MPPIIIKELLEIQHLSTCKERNCDYDNCPFPEVPFFGRCEGRLPEKWNEYEIFEAFDCAFKVLKQHPEFPSSNYENWIDNYKHNSLSFINVNYDGLEIYSSKRRVLRSIATVIKTCLNQIKIHLGDRKGESIRFYIIKKLGELV